MHTINHTLFRVRQSLKTVRDPVIRERLMLVKARYETRSLRRAGERCGTSYIRVKRWTDRYGAEGLRGLRPKPKSGRPPKLDPKKAKRIKQAVLKESAREGWQTTRLREYIQQRGNVTYSERHILRIAADWGLSRITPRPRYVHSDETKRVAFLKEEQGVSTP